MEEAHTYRGGREEGTKEEREGRGREKGGGDGGEGGRKGEGTEEREKGGGDGGEKKEEGERDKMIEEGEKGRERDKVYVLILSVSQYPVQQRRTKHLQVNTNLMQGLGQQELPLALGHAL